MPVKLDRQIKRFDLKLRRLEQAGEIAHDSSLPSLLTPGAGVGTPVKGATTPSNTLTINTAHPGGQPNIANAAMARMAAANSARSSPISAPNPLLNQAHLNAAAARAQRESSADAAKRRRLNTSQSSNNLPTQSSALRQSSTGPSGGTPKAGTPVPSSSRAGSAQPSRPNTTKKAPSNKKVAPHHVAAQAASRKRIRTSASGIKKADRRRNITSPTPSSSRGSASPTPSSLPQIDGVSDPRSRRRGHASIASDDEADEPEQDAEGDEIYCVCQQVSYGDMVACDNEECPYQWFHWTCVGLKAEPKGDWLCPHCRDLPTDKIVKAKDEK